MLTQAFSASLSTFLLGLSIACFIGAVAAVLSEAHKESRGPQRERPEPVEPMDFAGEIRVRDRSRRGPQPIDHPAGKERLGVGRRSA